MKYKPYSEIDLQEILDNTRSVSSDPYKLFVAYVLNAITEYLETEDEDTTALWGASLPKSDIENLLKSCIDDFTTAAKQGLRIDIGNQSFTIRGASKINYEKLEHIFGFSSGDTDVYISKDHIYDISQTIASVDEVTDNRIFAIKVWYACEQMPSGWDEITDMEAAVYCWMLYAKKPNATFSQAAFEKWFEYNEVRYLDVSFSQIQGCLEGGKQFPKSPFSFSANKVRALNAELHQKSFIDTIDEKLAVNYWYQS